MLAVCRPGTNCMAGRAVHIPVANMFLVAEIYGECLGPLRSSQRAPGLMAFAARTYVFAAHLCRRAVTLETSDVGIRSRRHRQSRSAPDCAVAGRAICLLDMRCVAELYVKTPQCRKRLNAGWCVANYADGTLIVGKLLHMTPGARHVSGKLRLGRTLGTLVTQ